MPEKNKPISARKKQNKKGFSFIEVMLSVFLIVVGVLAAVNLLGKGLKDSIDSRDQLVASLLAQEGVELARNLRDQAWASATSTIGQSFNNLPTNNAVNCIISYKSSLTCGQTFSAETLYLDAGGFYDTTSSASPTKFKRKIDIVYDNGVAATANNATVTSMVIWGGAAFPANCNTLNKCSYAETRFTRWGEQ